MLILSLLFSALVSTAEASVKIHYQDCQPEGQQEKYVYSNDFRWYYTLPEMLVRFQEIYSSGKRLKYRAYVDAKDGQLYLPYKVIANKRVKVPLSFVRNVKTHIEEAFKYNYIDGVFFPDMGHSHFFIPEKKYYRLYRDIPVDEGYRFYEMVLADPDLRILYHTAEQLKSLDENKKVLEDRHVQWRFYTRNLVGRNSKNADVKVIRALDNPANTLGQLKGYYYYGAGFNLSASKDGCFEYEKDGEKYRFDLSLYDLEPEHGSVNDYY